MSNQAADRLGKWLAIGGTLLAAVAVVLGIRTMGLPAQQRQMRIEERRVEELRDIQMSVVAFAKEADGLPASLAQMAAKPGVTIPRDPETGAPYEYERIDADRFRLCAVFTTDTARTSSENWLSRSPEWAHGTGRQCFTRTRKAD
jgi:hypothetical protein